MRRNRDEPRQLGGVEFLDVDVDVDIDIDVHVDAPAPSPSRVERSTRSSGFTRALLVAVTLSAVAVALIARQPAAISGRPVAAPAPKLESHATSLNDGFLTAWHYGLPGSRLHRAPGAHYLAVARGAGSEILVVSIGSRGCPTLVTSVAVYSNTEFAITEDQLSGFSGCYLGTSAITNVLLVPAIDLTRPVTIELGTASVVLPPS